MFIDTHTHLFVEEFNEDRNIVIKRAIDAGVEMMLLPNIDVDTVEAMHQLARAFPTNCFPMMGLHPGSVDANWETKLETIRTHLFSGKYVAVGEIGMDLYWDKTHIEAQKKVFRTHIEWAKKLKLPIVIHAREAFQEIFEIVDELNDERLTGVFHCFTGTADDAAKIIGYGGFKLGLGGVLTYKNAKLDESLKNVPLEYIVLETDSPYLPPVPHRGKRNESAYLLHVAEKLAEIYGCSLKQIEEQTTKNAVELFQLGN